MDKIKEYTDKLGEEIKGTELFKEYSVAKEAHDNDKALQDLIGEFNLKRYNLIEEDEKDDSEKDEAKLSRLNEELKAIYAQIMGNDVMQKYLVVKRDFDEMIKEVYDILNFHITGEEPQSSCGSNCSSCSGCH